MTDQAKLERAYRRLLAWYPRRFRDENGQEMLAVLMACAAGGRRRPGLAQAADVIRGGLWMRLFPSVPRSARTVRAAVRFMYAGAAVSTVNLIVLLAVIADIKAYHAVLGYRLTAAQASQFNTLAITVGIVSDLVPIGLWLWMAGANGRGRNWARGLSTALFGVATLDLTGAFETPVFRVSFVPMLFGPTLPVLTWLAGAGAVGLLWCLHRVLPSAGPGADAASTAEATGADLPRAAPAVTVTAIGGALAALASPAAIANSVQPLAARTHGSGGVSVIILAAVVVVLLIGRVVIGRRRG
jgi:hypothetical protein